jgi:K+/H+ antiporter YhaU regulatory subunit KhtT
MTCTLWSTHGIMRNMKATDIDETHLKKKKSESPPVFSRIALDIASRIARGELQENTKLYGRSVMSSEYGVSPETIRRSFALLEEMNVVEIKHNSGVVIVSQENALKFINKYSDHADTRQLLYKLKLLVEKQAGIDREIRELTKTILDATERYANNTPFHNYSCMVPLDSPLINKTIGEINFWQRTKATIIAIRRNDKIILSPGPSLELLAMDTLILVGNTETQESVVTLLRNFPNQAE